MQPYPSGFDRRKVGGGGWRLLASGMRFGTVLLLCGLASCGAQQSVERFTDGLAALEIRPVDDLLAKARTQIGAGAAGDRVREEILQSEAPQHERAKRLLRAIADSAPDPSSPYTEIDQSVGPKHGKKTAKAPVARVPPKHSSEKTQLARPLAQIHGIGLARQKNGAVIRLHADRRLAIGMAQQLERGLLRLVVDADVADSVLRSRPSIPGARVTQVQRAGKSVFITISLGPGWRLGNVASNRLGAVIGLRHLG